MKTENRPLDRTQISHGSSLMLPCWITALVVLALFFQGAQDFGVCFEDLALDAFEVFEQPAAALGFFVAERAQV